MTGRITRKVAFVLADDFEDSEFVRPLRAVLDAGHEAVVVGVDGGQTLTGKRAEERATTDVAARDVSSDEFDALVVPGGYSPDKLRTDENTVRLVHDMVVANKPVAAICHGASLLVEAGVVADRTLTCWPSVRTDVENAGGHWIDRQLVADGNLITSRKPEDLDAFCGALLQRLAEA